jgi:hypothetical protein
MSKELSLRQDSLQRAVTDLMAASTNGSGVLPRRSEQQLSGIRTTVENACPRCRRTMAKA